MSNTEKYRKVMTTSQVANILKVSPRTVSKWGDSGKLKQWKINKDRRFNLADVVEFAKLSGMQALISDFELEEKPEGGSTSSDLNKKVLGLVAQVRSAINKGKSCLEDRTYKISIDDKNNIISIIDSIERKEDTNS